MGTSNETKPGDRQEEQGHGDVLELRAQTGGGDIVTVGHPATPEDAAKLKRIFDDFDKDPEKYADYEWQQVD